MVGVCYTRVMAYRDKDKLRAYQAKWHREYRAKHPERHAGYEAKRDKDARAAERRARRADGRDDSKTILKRSYRKHREKRLAAMKVWRANPTNKESMLAYMRSFKAQRRANPPVGMYTMDDVEQMYLDQAGECAGCGGMLNENYHVDHVNPLARNGTNSAENLELLCRLCNQSKGYKTWTEWRFDRHA
jgi:5-methylcytosine-specific restriction endonuclease McrA